MSMSVYIDKATVVREIKSWIRSFKEMRHMESASDCPMILDSVTKLPGADVVPVRHGKWELIKDSYCGFDDFRLRCSACGKEADERKSRRSSYCPDCGAKMDAGEE